MQETDLNDFMVWQQEKPELRSVKIEIKPLRYGKQSSIWVYDYSLCEGQVVTSVDEIDLEALIEKSELETLRKLKEKYGEGRG